MITIKSRGNFSKLEKMLKQSIGKDYKRILDRYAKEGVKALSEATPVDTGKTASSWGYEIVQENGRISIHWTNSNVNEGVNIALILQYGHGTGTGGYVQGVDYINPALRPIFDALADAAWKEVVGS